MSVTFAYTTSLLKYWKLQEKLKTINKGAVLGFVWIILILGSLFALSGLVRKFGSHTLLNGFMSKEQADDVFPEWRKPQKDDTKEREQDNNRR